MRYDELCGYMEILKRKSDINSVRIDWDVIKADQIAAFSPKYMGMQIADAIASSFFFGAQINQYGFVEDRYIRMLKPVVYHNRGRYNGYGLKIWPGEAEQLMKQQSHMTWLSEVYSF